MSLADCKITHVIFDMDGLILNTETLYEEAITKVAKSFGRDLPFEVKVKITGRKGDEGAEILINELSLPITVEEYSKLIDEQYRKIFSQPIDLMPGADKLIRHLHLKNIPIAVATSSKGFAFDLKTKTHKELFGLFHHILIASDDPEIKRGKPDPQTFLVCASRFDNPPTNMENVLVFEDSVMGVMGANAAGMKSVWVPESRLSKDAVKATLILDSLEEFKPEQFGLPPFDN